MSAQHSWNPDLSLPPLELLLSLFPQYCDDVSLGLWGVKEWLFYMLLGREHRGPYACWPRDCALAEPPPLWLCFERTWCVLCAMGPSLI